jgi:hypothetical protein
MWTSQRCDWSSDVCSSDLEKHAPQILGEKRPASSLDHTTWFKWPVHTILAYDRYYIIHFNCITHLPCINIHIMGGYVSVHYSVGYALFCTLLHNLYIHLWNNILSTLTHSSICNINCLPYYVSTSPRKHSSSYFKILCSVHILLYSISYVYLRLKLLFGL